MPQLKSAYAYENGVTLIILLIFSFPTDGNSVQLVVNSVIRRSTTAQLRLLAAQHPPL